MTNEIIKGGDAGNLELSTDINVITAEINAYQRVAGEAIFEIGRRLKHVKENDLAHGEWSKWCESEIGLTRDMARRYVKVYEEFGEGKHESIRGLGIAALYEITTLPPEQRDQPHTLADGTTKKPDEMTVRELREVKKALKEAEARRQQAEQRARQAEQEAQTARRSEEIAQRQLEEFDHGKPEVEIRTEYVEVAVENPAVAERLRKYEEMFGSIENFEERPMVTNQDTVTTAILAFSKDAQDLARKHAFLLQYQGTIARTNEMIRKEYEEAVEALQMLARDFGRTVGASGVIDAEYTEI